MSVSCLGKLTGGEQDGAAVEGGGWLSRKLASEALRCWRAACELSSNKGHRPWASSQPVTAKHIGRRAVKVSPSAGLLELGVVLVDTHSTLYFTSTLHRTALRLVLCTMLTVSGRQASGEQGVDPRACHAA